MEEIKQEEITQEMERIIAHKFCIRLKSVINSSDYPTVRKVVNYSILSSERNNEKASMILEIKRYFSETDLRKNKIFLAFDFLSDDKNPFYKDEKFAYDCFPCNNIDGQSNYDELVSISQKEGIVACMTTYFDKVKKAKSMEQGKNQ